MERVQTGKGGRVWRWQIVAPDGAIVPTGSTETEAPFRRWALWSAKRFLARHLESLERETAAQQKR